MAANFCREFLRPKERFDPHSFRMKVIGKKKDHRLLVACPQGSWDDDNKRCGESMKAVSLLHPKVEKKCPRGKADFKTKGFPLEGLLGPESRDSIRYTYKRWGEKAVREQIAKRTIYESLQRIKGKQPKPLADEAAEYLTQLMYKTTNGISLGGANPGMTLAEKLSVGILGGLFLVSAARLWWEIQTGFKSKD